jgi:hypothetical protein
MKYRTLIAVLVALTAAYMLGAQGRVEPKVQPSPHGEAIQLVIKTQQARLREVERENWDHDVKDRTWVVRRPFHPGVIDSTRMFNVSYRIDGKEVASWLVDTTKGTVQSADGKVKKL